MNRTKRSYKMWRKVIYKHKGDCLYYLILSPPYYVGKYCNIVYILIYVLATNVFTICVGLCG